MDAPSNYLTMALKEVGQLVNHYNLPRWFCIDQVFSLVVSMIQLQTMVGKFPISISTQPPVQFLWTILSGIHVCVLFLGESAASIFVIICNKYRYCIVLKIILLYRYKYSTENNHSALFIYSRVRLVIKTGNTT